MACSSCNKKRGRVSRQQTIRTNNGTSRNGVLSAMNTNDFQSKFYIGEDGTIDSEVKGINYGHRKYGAKMLVHTTDLQNKPKLWVDKLPNIVEEVT